MRLQVRGDDGIDHIVDLSGDTPPTPDEIDAIGRQFKPTSAQPQSPVAAPAPLTGTITPRGTTGGGTGEIKPFAPPLPPGLEEGKKWDPAKAAISLDPTAMLRSNPLPLPGKSGQNPKAAQGISAGTRSAKIPNTDITLSVTGQNTFRAVSPTLGTFSGSKDQIAGAIDVATYLKSRGIQKFTIVPAARGNLRLNTNLGEIAGSPEHIIRAHHQVLQDIAARTRASAQIESGKLAMAERDKSLDPSEQSAERMTSARTIIARGLPLLSDEKIASAKKAAADPQAKFAQEQRAKTQAMLDSLHRTGEAINRVIGQVSTATSLGQFIPGARPFLERINTNLASGVNPISQAEFASRALNDPAGAASDITFAINKIWRKTDEDGKPISMMDRIDGLMTLGGTGLAVVGFGEMFKGKGLPKAEVSQGIVELLDRGVKPADLEAAMGRGAKTEIQSIERNPALADRIRSQRFGRSEGVGEIQAPVRAVEPPIPPRTAVESSETIRPLEIATERPNPPIQEPPVEIPVKTERPVTGLTNAVQEQEALDGIIRDVDKSFGQSAKAWQEDGKANFNRLAETDEGRIRAAEDLARRIADEDEPLNALNVGTLLEAKRNMLGRISELEGRLAEGGGKDVLEQLRMAEDGLSRFLGDIQQGKGQWADVGRALQAGSTVNEGVFAEVVAKMEAKGKAVPENLRAQIKEATARVAERDLRIGDLEKALAEERANPKAYADEPVAPTRKYDRKKITRNIESLLAEWNDAKPVAAGGKGGKQAGAIKITREDIKLLGKRYDIAKQLVKAHIDLHVNAPLEDVVVAIQKTFRDRLGVDIDRQAVIDMAAEKGPTRTRSETAKARQDLMNQLRRESTEVKDRIATREKAKAEAKAAKAEFERRRRAAAQAERLVAEVEEQASKARAKERAADAKANMDAAWAAYQEKERIAAKEAKRVERTEASIESAKRDIEDLRKQLEEGRFRVAGKRERILNADLENERGLRRAYANDVRRIMQQHDIPVATRTLRAATGGIRGLKLGSDVGVTMRQGLFGLGEPKAMAKAIGEGAKVLFSEKNLGKWENASMEKQIGGRYMEPIRRKAGLSRTNAKLNPEELGIGRILDKVPIVGGALERYQHVFLNTLRNEVFDASYIRGLSESELKQRGSFINNISGRGNIRDVPAALEAIMTSPRYEASRWGTIGELVKNPLTLIKDGRINRAAVQNIRTAAQAAGSIYVLMRAAELAGYKVDLDSDSSDFLKMRRFKDGHVEWDAKGPHYVGGAATDDVWDLSAGLAPRMRDLFRTVTALQKPERMKNLTDIWGKAAVRTASPGITTPIEQGSYALQRRAGVEEKDLKSPLSGWVPDDEAKGWWALAPLIAVSFAQAGKGDAEEGDTSLFQSFNEKSAAWAWFREFVGTGVSRYPSNKRDALGRTMAEQAAGDPVLKEAARIGFEGSLQKLPGEDDKQYEARKQAFADTVYPDFKALIEDKSWEDLTLTQKLDALKEAWSVALREFNTFGGGAEATENAKDVKEKAHADKIEKERKAGVK